MPNLMCSTCVMHLGIASNFKEQCIRSETQLREVLMPVFQNKIGQKKSEKQDEAEANMQDVENDQDSDCGYDNVEITKDDSDELTEEKYVEESEHRCDDCGRTFRLASGLRTHSLKHGKKLKCEVCGKEFSRMYLLT